ncbi:MAG: hypothetical protein EOR22_28005, partial [Mesorhizobium sp.]
ESTATNAVTYTTPWGTITGGTFMGYRSEDGSAVVTALVTAGPKARRGSHSFTPDQEWQQAEIARLYEISGRRDAYLGDWHTHPDATDGTLSWRDRRCLKRIIKTPFARNAAPIMMILCGSPNEWAACAWRATIEARLKLFERLGAAPIEINGYESSTRS